MNKDDTDVREVIFTCLIKALVDSGTIDPDVRLFWAVLNDDVPLLKKAIKDGANVNGTDSALIKKHHDTLTTGEASSFVTKNLLEMFFSAGSKKPKIEDEK